MINGVIQAPESPQTEGFAPTMMNDIKAADPTAKINLIAPPQANNRGTANLQYAVRDAASTKRHGAPHSALQYSSEGGSGWLGEGWSLSAYLPLRWTPDGACRVMTVQRDGNLPALRFHALDHGRQGTDGCGPPWREDAPQGRPAVLYPSRRRFQPYHPQGQQSCQTIIGKLQTSRVSNTPMAVKVPF